MTATVLRGDANHIPLADNTVDLVVSSPPYFSLRSYQDGGEHYSGQIGSEATPAEFVDALLGVTRECVRVLKPSGSLWINLGDKYGRGTRATSTPQTGVRTGSVPGRATVIGHDKSLMGIPWRYAIACIDQLGLILRAEVIWSKPNGLPESVTDRVRRSHEQWFHFTLGPRYYSAVDEIREPHVVKPFTAPQNGTAHHARAMTQGEGHHRYDVRTNNPLGKLPGSVWTIPTEPLTVPDHLGIDHFAAFPLEWPLQLIRGWSPRGVCTACGEGRRPVVHRVTTGQDNNTIAMVEGREKVGSRMGGAARSGAVFNAMKAAGGGDRITGYACACAEPTAPTRPSVILDPFGGTGTTALAAHALGRHGITLDMSADYSRLARWRTTDEREYAKALRVEKPKVQVDGQGSLMDYLEEAT
jgi:DNA modification methylase